MSSNFEKRWWLVAAVQSVRPESKADIHVIREVSDSAELEGLRSANKLLNRQAQQPAYNELVEVYDDLYSLLTGMHGNSSPPVTRVVNDLNRLALALGHAARKLCDEAVTTVRADFGDGSAELDLIEDAVREESNRAPFELLLRISEQESRCFAEVDGAIGNDLAALAALRAELPHLADDVDLISAMESGVLIAQRIVARRLQLYEARITEAMRLLRSVGAEALEGSPGLMLSDLDLSAGRIDMSSMSFDPLALEAGAALLRALRQSRTLPNASDESAQDYGERERDAASGPRSEGAAREGELEDAGSGDSAADQPAGSDSAQSSFPSAVDLDALIAHVLELSDELEGAWSAALTPETLAPALADLEARIGTLLLTYQRQLGASSAAVAEEGFNTLLPAYPLPAAEYENISFDPDPARGWLQLQAAVVDALIQVGRNLVTIRAPVPHLRRASGTVENWWASGAFDLIRESLQTLHRLVRASEHAEGILLQRSDADRHDHVATARLELLEGAVVRGDFEAAFIHADLALRIRAESWTRAVPADLLDRIAEDPRLGESAILIRLLATGTVKVRQGEPLDAGAAAVVAPPLARLIHSLCLGEAEVIRAAVSPENNGRETNKQGKKSETSEHDG